MLFAWNEYTFHMQSEARLWPNTMHPAYFSSIKNRNYRVALYPDQNIIPLKWAPTINQGWENIRTDNATWKQKNIQTNSNEKTKQQKCNHRVTGIHVFFALFRFRWLVLWICVFIRDKHPGKLFSCKEIVYLSHQCRRRWWTHCRSIYSE